MAALFLVSCMVGCACAGDAEQSAEGNLETADESGYTWNEENEIYKEDYLPEGGAIAFVTTSTGRIDDGNFNETIFAGVQTYAYAADISYSYYQPENSSREALEDTLKKALSFDNCTLVVVAGSAYDEVITPVQAEYPDRNFLLIGCRPRDAQGEAVEPTPNVHCVAFREEEAGYLAGYMAVLDGYRSLGFIGGEKDEGVIRYGCGYLQGIDDAAYDLSITDEVKVQYAYAGTFRPADFIYELSIEWYQNDTEVIFCCGGPIYEAVLLAADTCDKQIIGVDINQNGISSHVLTSAMKGLDRAVIIAMDDYFATKGWSAEFSGTVAEYGVKENCCALPTKDWRFVQATSDDYENLRSAILNGATEILNTEEVFAQIEIPVDLLEVDAQSETMEWTHAESLQERLDAEKGNAPGTDGDAIDPEDASADGDGQDGDATAEEVAQGSGAKDWHAAYEEAVADLEILERERYLVPKAHLNMNRRTQGEIDFQAENALTYARSAHCLIQGDEVVFQCEFDEIPSSDDAYLYLCSLAPWEKEEDIEDHIVGTMLKGYTMEYLMPYEEGCLYQRYVPALMEGGCLVPVSYGKYITNPQVLAARQDPYPEVASKKGLLIDPRSLVAGELPSINLKRAVYNIPLSQLFGPSANPELQPTIYYEYDGNTYEINTASVNALDFMFTYMTSANICATAIVLNDWNETCPELIHPLSRNRTKNSLYYAFNTEEEEGVRMMEVAANFLAQRYSSGEYGIVHDWVIANEINQKNVWNYMDTEDIELYAESFETAFRIFYNTIKKYHANAKVYYSLDHDWNDNGGKNSRWFNGRELMYAFNKYALRGGNYDWRISVHPYPDPLTKVNYWKAEYDMTENAPVLTIMNLTALTDILDRPDFQNPAGQVRGAAITELGFSSYSGEKLQAAAFEYCYYIIDENPYIESFLLNRQTDSELEMQSKLALGLLNTDRTPKFLNEVYTYIDTERAEEYLPFMLNILGADSLEEALSWAKP